MEKVVIIIPTYNEGEVIEETLASLAEVRNHIADFDVNVLIFDSASTDKTQSIVKTLQADRPWLSLQTEDRKSGLGSAYWQAMQYALTQLNADIIIEFDADLSHQPKYIAPMLERLKSNDVVLGSRYVKGGKIPSDWGWHRKIISVFGNYLARAALTCRYKDFTSGFRLTRAASLEKALSKPFLSNHYAYKLHLLWSLHKQGARIDEYPIVFIDRTKGQSKLPANSITDSLRVIWLLLTEEMSYRFKRITRS